MLAQVSAGLDARAGGHACGGLGGRDGRSPFAREVPEGIQRLA